MLPLFTESSNSPVMIYHALHTLIKVTDHLNPGQTAVVTLDEPLYTKGKQIQWAYPDNVGEDKIVLILAPMHTEKVGWGMCGEFLDGSGWTAMLTNAAVTSSGRAQSFIGVSHICRTRFYHQATAAAIFLHQSRAYNHYKDSKEEAGEDAMVFDDWFMQKCAEQPQAFYWNKAMQMELTVLEVRHENRC